jgi:hypothetical protein
MKKLIFARASWTRIALICTFLFSGPSFAEEHGGGGMFQKSNLHKTGEPILATPIVEPRAPSDLGFKYNWINREIGPQTKGCSLNGSCHDAANGAVDLNPIGTIGIFHCQPDYSLKTASQNAGHTVNWHLRSADQLCLFEPQNKATLCCIKVTLDEKARPLTPDFNVGEAAECKKKVCGEQATDSSAMTSSGQRLPANAAVDCALKISNENDCIKCCVDRMTYIKDWEMSARKKDGKGYSSDSEIEDDYLVCRFACHDPKLRKLGADIEAIRNRHKK